MNEPTPANVVFLDPAEVQARPLEATDAQRKMLETINRKVAGAESLDAVMDFVFERSVGVCPCDRLGLAFVEDDGRRAVARWARAAYEPLVLNVGYAEDMQGSTLERVLHEGRLRIIHDLDAYLRDKPESRSTRILVREGVRSSMTCPLQVEGRNVGFLFRSSREPSAFTEDHARLHLAVAERLSQAVEKAWRIEQLEAANRAYTEMLGFVSHELKSPIASMVMTADLLQGGTLGKVAPRQRERLQSLMAKGQYLLGIVRDYLDLARIEGGELRANIREGIDFLAEVVAPAVDIMAPQIEAAAVRLTRDLPEEAVEVECDPDLMKIVLVNLLGNAVKYGNEGGEVRLTVDRTDDALRVAVWNEGPGFPASERDKLFRKFSRLDTPELRRRKGTGVGLYTCWQIVQRHHGRMTADSEEGRWAEFAFTLPQPVPRDEEGNGWE